MHGTGERMSVINKFVADNPVVSVRQVTLKFSEVTTRDRPQCVPEKKLSKKVGRAFMFYLRPRFYRYLPPDERPVDWEKYAADDEILWQDEKKVAEAKEDSKSDLNSVDMNSSKAATNDGMDTGDEDDDASSIHLGIPT
jgi:hypothetical protein